MFYTRMPLVRIEVAGFVLDNQMSRLLEDWELHGFDVPAQVDEVIADFNANKDADEWHRWRDSGQMGDSQVCLLDWLYQQHDTRTTR